MSSVPSFILFSASSHCQNINQYLKISNTSNFILHKNNINLPGKFQKQRLQNKTLNIMNLSSIQTKLYMAGEQMLD